MFKKLLSGILALTMCLSFAGCSEREDSSSADTSSDLTSEASAPESSDSAESDDPSSDGPSSDDSSVPDKPDEADGITPAMWKASGKDGTPIYFLGSMHALNSDCYPLPSEIMDAYNSSDSLAVECDIYAYQKDFDAQAQLVMNMMYIDGTTIADHIDPDLYASAKQILSDAGLYMALYDYYNVIMWQSLVEMAMIDETGLASEYGIDMNLLTMAHKEGKNIIEIESVDFQNELLYTQPEELNVYMLETAVYYYEDQCEELLKTFEAWCAGTFGEYMENEEEVDPDDYEDIEISDELLAMIENYNKALIDDRNKGMAEKAVEMLENGESVFYVVGAAHFYGDTGIIKLLEDAGYTLEPVEYK